jgi:hypothetical protein
LVELECDLPKAGCNGSQRLDELHIARDAALVAVDDNAPNVLDVILLTIAQMTCHIPQDVELVLAVQNVI